MTDLFDANDNVVQSGMLSAFPVLLPDETFYSVCARFNWRCGYGSARSLGRLLFGCDSASRHRALPQGLGCFTELFGGTAWSPNELIRRSTCAAAYLPFMTQDDKESLLAACVLPASSRTLANGWLSGHVLGHEPLRACPKCVAKDQADNGIAFWRLAHQLPSTWMCVMHQSPLRSVAPKVLQGRRWLLPQHSEMSGDAVGQNDRWFQLKFAGCMVMLSRYHSIDMSTLSAEVWERLGSIGIQKRSMAGRIHAARWFSGLVPELSCGRARFERDGNWVYDLICLRSRPHPVRWALVLTCLRAAGMGVTPKELPVCDPPRIVA